MKTWVKKSVIALSTLVMTATIATPTFADTTTPPTWSQGQTIEISMHKVWDPYFRLKQSTDIYFEANGIYKTATATMVSGTEVHSQQGHVEFADYTFTVPNLGNQNQIFKVAEQNYDYVIDSELTYSSSLTPITQFEYSSVPAGLLPEFPYAGAVPLFGLLGVGAVAYFVRQRKSEKA
nr:hypothetical protein [Bacilli bacterium]